MFWENFIELCKNKNVSPNGLAKELSISSGAVTAWKNGRVPKWQTLEVIANYFDVTVEELIADKKEKVPPELPAGLDEKDIKIISKLMTLNGEDKELALSYMQFLADRRKASQENQ